MSNTLRITPLGPHIGAEISGIQLAEPLSDSHFGQIHQALLSHQARIQLRSATLAYAA